MTIRTKYLLALLLGIGLSATPAWADFKLERRLALEPGGTFVLETDVGAVTLTGDSSSGATVTVTSRRDDLDKRFDFRFEENAGSVKVSVKRRGGWLSGFWGGGWFGENTHFAIHVPMRTAVSLNTSGGSIEASRLSGRVGVHTSGGGLRVEDVDGNVDGTTSGGSIRMQDVRGDVTAHTSGGGIVVADVRGRLRAETSGGSIDVDKVSGDLYANTSGGGVDVRAAGGRVEAHSSGGSVTVSFAAGNARGGILSTSGGGVRAEVDPTAALSIDASSSGGGVSADLPVTVQGRIESNSLRGDLNGGGALLRMRSSGGGVRITGTSSSAARR